MEESILPIALATATMVLTVLGSFLMAGWAARRSGPRLWLLTAPGAGLLALVAGWVALRLLFS